MFTAHDRYHYYYGQKVARLDRYQSLFDSGNRGKRTALAALLSPVLFNAPEVHLKSLERIWVDQIINEIPWSQFIQKLQTDWQEAVLTVCRHVVTLSNNCVAIRELIIPTGNCVTQRQHIVHDHQ